MNKKTKSVLKSVVLLSILAVASVLFDKATRHLGEYAQLVIFLIVISIIMILDNVVDYISEVRR